MESIQTATSIKQINWINWTFTLLMNQLVTVEKWNSKQMNQQPNPLLYTNHKADSFDVFSPLQQHTSPSSLPFSFKNQVREAISKNWSLAYFSIRHHFTKNWTGSTKKLQNWSGSTKNHHQSSSMNLSKLFSLEIGLLHLFSKIDQYRSSSMNLSRKTPSEPFPGNSLNEIIKRRGHGLHWLLFVQTSFRKDIGVDLTRNWNWVNRISAHWIVAYFGRLNETISGVTDSGIYSVWEK